MYYICFVYVYPLNGYRELNSFEEPCFTLVVTITFLARELNPTGIGEHIYCHPQRDCFIVSQNFSVARHARFTKLGSKPGLLKRRFRDSTVCMCVRSCPRARAGLYVCVCVCVCVSVSLSLCVCVCGIVILCTVSIIHPPKRAVCFRKYSLVNFAKMDKTTFFFQFCSNLHFSFTLTCFH